MLFARFRQTREGDPVSKLSDRLAEAKTELGISTRRMVEEAAKGGYSLSNHSASVYTSGKHPERPDPRTLEALGGVVRGRFRC